MIQRLFLLTFLLIISSVIIKAQTLGGTLMLGLPQGEFKDNVDNNGYGLQVQGTLSSPGVLSPFTIGLSLGYLNYGSESGRRPLSNTIPDVTVEVDRDYSLANFHLLAVLSPFPGTIKPYAEGIVGGAYLFTTTEVKGDDDDRKIASSTNFDDFAFNYGVGGGFLILLADPLDEIGPKIYLDLKARYIFGNEAEYLTEGSVRVNTSNGTVFYDVQKSKTDLLTIGVGVVAYF